MRPHPIQSNVLNGYCIEPNDNQPLKRMVLLLHGYGSNAKDLLSLAVPMQPALQNTVFISPNAPTPCAMNPMSGYEWFSIGNENPEVTLQEMRQVSATLKEFIAEQLAHYKLDYRQLATVGFSQGTMVSLYTALRDQESYGAVLGYSGRLIDGESLTDELTQKPPVCLIHGDDDDVVPHSRLDEAVMYLKQHNIPHQAHTCQGLGHSISEEGLEAGIAFLQKHG